MDTNQIVVSRDGVRAVLVEHIDPTRHRPRYVDGFNLEAKIRLRPREEVTTAEIYVSGPFRALWNNCAQRLRWDQEFDAALPDLVMIGIGEFLDTNEVPARPAPGEYSFEAPVTSYSFDIFKREPLTEPELESYITGRVYWTWKYKAEPTVFADWEARRLRLDVSDLRQGAFGKTGVLWQSVDGEAFRALPQLINTFERKLAVTPSSAQRSPKYDVALSFAGEQRDYVQAVAEYLRVADVSVFYDDFADLWGKDLTRELEAVYKSQSRYVVVFVSKEYVAKAWPNLERQHALAGRIERMDDSVLPARFDPIPLPRLPATVGYLDIGSRTPKELADLIFAKLKPDA